MKTFEEYHFKIKHSSISNEHRVKTFDELEEGDFIYYIDEQYALCALITGISKNKEKIKFEAQDGDSYFDVNIDYIDEKIEVGINGEIVTTDPEEANILAKKNKLQIKNI